MDLLVISGGSHPYEESTPVLTRFLVQAGHTVTVTEDSAILADAGRMSDFDALVFNTMRVRDITLSEGEQAGMKDYISSGNGFVCIHISGCVPDTWPEYQEITGGGWVMGESYHPPYGKFTVNVTQPGHPGVRGRSRFRDQRRALHGYRLPGRQRRVPQRRLRRGHLRLGRPGSRPHAGRYVPARLDSQLRRRQGLRDPAGPQRSKLRDA